MPDPKVTPQTEIELEDEWDEADLKRILGDALNPDGSIDYAKLDERTTSMTLEDFFPEGDEEDEA